MEELKNIKVALLGSGTVGTGVYKLIERQREELPHKVGAGLTVSKVLVRDKNKKREVIDPSVLTLLYLLTSGKILSQMMRFRS